MRDFLPRRTRLVNASKVLHGVHNDGGNSIVVPFDEVDARLGTFRKEDVIGAIDDGYSGNVSVIGRLEAHHDRLVVA